jgi:hypothetical protein
MDGIRDLRLLLASRHPLIVARMDDETRFMSFARRAAELCGYPVWTASVTLGLARDGNASQVDTQEPKKALAFVRQLQPRRPVGLRRRLRMMTGALDTPERRA